jgi:hypothetical protein
VAFPRLARLALAVLPALLGAEEDAKDWTDHTGKLDFVVGYDKGLEEATFTGKPMMAFFTTTW